MCGKEEDGKETKRPMQGKGCIIESLNYEPDSEVCDDKLCYVCKDGIWQEKGALDIMADFWAGGV